MHTSSTSTPEEYIVLRSTIVDPPYLYFELERTADILRNYTGFFVIPRRKSRTIADLADSRLVVERHLNEKTCVVKIRHNPAATGKESR